MPIEVPTAFNQLASCMFSQDNFHDSTQLQQYQSPHELD